MVPLSLALMFTNLINRPSHQTTPPKKALLANVLLLLVYAAIVCFTAAHHEPWCDEADPWLLARDENFAGIMARMNYVGSSALWYLLLVPFAKAGLPYIAMTAVNVVIVFLALALLVFRAPFSFWLKATVCFSYLFVYEYPVIARSYGLSALLIMSLAATYQYGKKHPLLYGLLIALLANTNVHGLIVAMGITAAFLFTKWRNGLTALAPVAVAAVGIILSILQVLPPADGQFPPKLNYDFWSHPVLNTFKGPFFPDPYTSLDHWVSEPFFGGSISLIFKLLAFAIIFLLIRKLWPHRFALFTFLLSYAGLFFLFAFKYYGSVRHWGFYILVALYCLWIQADDENVAEKSGIVGEAGATANSEVASKAGATANSEVASKASPSTTSETPDETTSDGKRSKLTARFDSALSILLLVSFTYSAGVGLYACVTEVERPFSSGLEMAAELSHRNIENVPVVCNPNVGLSVLPYLPTLKFYYPNLHEFGTHALWNRAEKQVLTTEQLCQIVDEKFGKQKILLLTDKEDPGLLKDGFTLVYRNQVAPITSSENLVLYSRN